MKKDSSFHQTINPISQEVKQPLWSIMIPTYNCAESLRETLHSVLEQDLGPEIMHIEVVDDYSIEDDPESIIRELAGERVSFYRQEKNVGYIRNFNTCLERSRGRLVHLLHGDDAVLHGFYKKMQYGFETKPEIGAAFCRHIHFDEQSNWNWISPLEQPQSGVLNEWLEKISVKQRIQAPSIVVKRQVYENIGGFDNRMSCWGEDWEMWVRIAAKYPVWYEPRPLALYRISPDSLVGQSAKNLTGRSTRTGQNIQDFRQAIEIVNSYLPQDRSLSLRKKALVNCGDYACFVAKECFKRRLNLIAFRQSIEAIKCYYLAGDIIACIKHMIRMPLLFFLAFLKSINISLTIYS